MNFELGKTYIVNVTEKGIIPSMEFDRSQWFNKDYDDLEFLTDKEKTAIVNDTLDKIRTEIIQLPYQRIFGKVNSYSLLDAVVEIIDKYKAKNEVKDKYFMPIQSLICDDINDIIDES